MSAADLPAEPHASNRRRRPRQFKNVVFAGGGNRCFWQAGFWSVAESELKLAPRNVVAVSAGSAIACTLFAGTFDDAFAVYKKAIDRNERNVYLRNLLRQHPVFPHGPMYRDAILGGLDAQALQRLHQGPGIHVLISCPPAWASPSVTIALGVLAAGWDSWGKEQVHQSLGSRIGFKPLYVAVQDCFTPPDVADLIIASSCIPPLTPRNRIKGVAPLDGGLVSNVPIDRLAGKSGETLVLLTRRFASLPSIRGRTYVQPSKTVPVGAWDYTNGAALQATYDLGRRDAENFCAGTRSVA